MGEAQAALHAKEEECLKMEQERDRLAKQLADQAAEHQAELHRRKDAEEAFQAEFETRRSNWVEKEKALSAGFGKVEDMLDGKLLFSFFFLPVDPSSRPPTSYFFLLLLNRVFPWLLRCRQTSRPGSSRGADAGWRDNRAHRPSDPC